MVQQSGEVVRCMTLLLELIVLVLRILVFGLEGIPNLFVVVVRLVFVSNQFQEVLER